MVKTRNSTYKEKQDGRRVTRAAAARNRCFTGDVLVDREGQELLEGEGEENEVAVMTDRDRTKFKTGRVTTRSTTAKGPELLAGMGVTRKIANKKLLSANKCKENVGVEKEKVSEVAVMTDQDRTEFLARRVTRSAAAQAKSVPANTREVNGEESDNSGSTLSEEHDDSQGEEEEKERGEEDGIECKVVGPEPKFLTAEKCDPDDILMHCPWMCTWVKPIPDKWRQYIVTAPNSNYIDYMNEKNRPNSSFKASNTYKRTVAHLWECGKKNKKNRSDWPSYFDRTCKGKKLKTTKIDVATLTSPMRRDHFQNNKRRYKTVETCDANDVVMKCPKLTCGYVKVLPKDLVRHVTTEVEGKILVVKTDKEATTAVRQTSQWKRMRLHALQCTDCIPSFFKERGGM
jgi:hypothetical protein